MSVRYGVSAYMEVLVGLRLSLLLLRLRECWLFGEDVACITISISAGVCHAGGLDSLPVAGELAVWKGKDGG